MSKIDLIRTEMMVALKEKNITRKNALSLLLAALKARFIDKRAELTESEENAVIVKEIKQTRETLREANGRQDVIDECNSRINIFSEFAPRLMADSEIKKIIEKTISRLNILKPEMKDKGAIMRAVMPELKDRADMEIANKMVENMLK
ncbi:MAG: GatB/YqeY domain-containing protein [Oscillospiraceae bacterium]|jgi:uncharacterized protein YqeY|nr:GatB/YqeY domain-containing protein [Oscillospiraceae bacterium]